MQLTVIVEDSLIGMDGDFRQVQMDFPEHLWAIQWQASAEHLELTHQSSTAATAETIQPYVTAWENAAPASPKPAR